MRQKHVVLSLLVIALVVAFRMLTTSSTGLNPASSSRTVPASASAPASSPMQAAGGQGGQGGHDVPVPPSCTVEVNQKLAGLLAQQQQQSVDNVMVCGVTISPSRTQSGGPHGSHQVLPLMVNLPGAGSKLVEVVTNDDLDGVVTAPKGAQVYAYGQAFFPSRGGFVAGIHDVHCATHRTADNGWVVVNGAKAPASCVGFHH